MERAVEGGGQKHMSERETRDKKQSGGQNGTTDKRAEGERGRKRERKPAVRKRGQLVHVFDKARSYISCEWNKRF